MKPPAVETCRVLELGTSEGANLIPLADAFPRAAFAGIDLAEQPVSRGQQTIREFGLKNINLRVMDLLDVDAALGTFDYIIAHGLYAWTPMHVRDKILALMQELLSPQGIGFVSYNTHPTGHVRKIVRDIMLHHIGGEQRPDQRLAKAREILKLLARERSQDELQKMEANEAALAAYAAELLLKRSDSSLFHDDLAPVYEPMLLSDFVSHAGAHKLQYLDDARNPDPRGNDVPTRMTPFTAEAVSAMARGNRIARLQYQDFLRMRSFRQSLLCRQEVALQPDWDPTQIEGCYAAAKGEETAEGTFMLVGDRGLSTTHPALLEFLRGLIASWPRAQAVSADHAGVAAELCKTGLIELHTTASRAVSAGEKPCAAPFIQFQARRGDPFVSTLLHRPLHVDEKVRRLFTLLDGSRDRQTLARAMNCDLEQIDKELQMAAGVATLVS